MARNVEIKARVSDAAGLMEKVAALAERGPTRLDQEDTFFCCASGRLKLRVLSPTVAELIYYERADSAGPKESRYMRTPSADPAGLKEVLARALGVAGVVRKRRWLYQVGQARIHLDEVEGLGNFVELEVVLRDDQPVSAGVELAWRIMHRLGIGEQDLVPQAYIELLAPRPLRLGEIPTVGTTR